MTCCQQLSSLLCQSVFPLGEPGAGLCQVRGTTPGSLLTFCGSELVCWTVPLENPLKWFAVRGKAPESVCRGFVGHCWSPPFPGGTQHLVLPSAGSEAGDGHCCPQGTGPGDLGGCSRRKLHLCCCPLVVYHKANMSNRGTCLEIWVPLDMNRKWFIEFTSHRINTPTGFWGEGSPNWPWALVWTRVLCLSWTGMCLN